MKEAELMIRNMMGMHARSSALFANTATRFKSEITVCLDGLEVNGKSILGVMMLAADQGSSIRVRAEGPDEDAAIAAITALVSGKFEGEP
jgi:phosphocarrier protein HPr